MTTKPTLEIKTPATARGDELRSSFGRVPLFYWGVLMLLVGQLFYFLSICVSLLRVFMFRTDYLMSVTARMLWFSGTTTTLGLLLTAFDLAFVLPFKRKMGRHALAPLPNEPRCTVALTAYNDEASIYDAVRDFLSRADVRRVIVVSNNSSDRTMERAREAGAIVYNEALQGYGACVFRCLKEALAHDDTGLVVVCEGDRTFRASDLDKFFAYIPHAEIVNGTRIVEQLRVYHTQITTLMYYGNFFVGKLLEVKHLGKGTFTDVGTTFKMMRKDVVGKLLPELNPSVNLEFNAHFLDTALEKGVVTVECPITFFPRVGESKGGNTNNLRALKVGLRMIWGMSFGWGSRPS